MEIVMAIETRTDLAALLLRLTLGVMYLAHGLVLKVLTFGVAGTVGFFVGIGLPAWLAYATIIGEILGGALLILGIGSRWVALALTPTLLGAIIWVHAGNGWVFSSKGGGWEYPAVLIAVSVAVALLGDGPYAIARSRH
jgi:putative oxidoreductase